MPCGCRRRNAIAALRDEALKVIAAPFKVLDTALAKTPYLLGNDFTVADLNVAAVISRAVDMDLSAWPHLKAWLTRCLDRPAARAALALKTKSDDETPAESPGASHGSTGYEPEAGAVQPRSVA